MLRTFIAIKATDPIPAAASTLIERLSKAKADVNWVEPQHLHITLNFLGDVDPNETPAICKSVADIAAKYEPFMLHAAGVGAFPNSDRPRTLWLGIEEGAETLQLLQADLERAMADLRFRPEARRYLPHLTLGRVRKGDNSLAPLAEAIQKEEGFDAGSFRAQEIVVFASERGKEGPLYIRLSGAQLGR